LEIQKEKLTAELVCLLDVRSLPQEIAQLKQLLDQFFINGASRIDLIAKIIDLDNQIGGYNFDIPLLEETQRSLTSVSEPIGNITGPCFHERLLRYTENIPGLIRLDR